MLTQSLYAQYSPWTDRSGTLSWFRLGLFLLLLLPGASIATSLIVGEVGPEPFEHQIHETGEWAVRVLLLSLFITPLRRIFKWNRVIGVRRMIGVAGFSYAFAHLVLYMAQEHWDLAKVASEIIKRFYLSVGFVSVAMLAVLALTSFDSMIRRLGHRWGRIHTLVYPAVALGLFHFFLQSKSDVFQPTIMAGLFSLLMLYRLTARAGFKQLPWWSLAVCALLGVGLTALIEYAWYALATGIPADRVFAANFQVFSGGNMRPAIIVGLFGGVLALAALLGRIVTRFRA
ncbi:MAG: sulfoxide reductase heme-binding subunit YedZ [Rhodobacteraceae bacterium]|nr:sulfoxide reductase heme-binding subunit YedZ [Paracoccaceae bacterium]